MTGQKPKTPEIRQRAAFPVVEGIGLAAGILKVPETLLKESKRKGCKAFLTKGRIDLGILVPFLFEMLQGGNENELPEGFSSWREVLESEKAKREAIKRQQDEKTVMPTADAIRMNAEAMAMVFSELERRDRELPPALAGLPAVEIYKRMSGDTEGIRKQLKSKFEEASK